RARGPGPRRPGRDGLGLARAPALLARLGRRDALEPRGVLIQRASGPKGTSSATSAPTASIGPKPKGDAKLRRQRAQPRPKTRPTTDAASSVSTTPTGPRKAPIMASSLTSPKPMPGNQVQ